MATANLEFSNSVRPDSKLDGLRMQHYQQLILRGLDMFLTPDCHINIRTKTATAIYRAIQTAARTDELAQTSRGLAVTGGHSEDRRKPPASIRHA